MNYVITGSIGHISKPLIEKLVAAGHSVKVISSNTERSKEITALGAIPLIGSVEDGTFLRSSFTGADAVYAMVPPNFGAADWKKHIEKVGKNYATALEGSSVKHVVNLSSIGGHLSQGCGPVNGLYGVEQALNKLKDIHVLHLRPGYFYYNFYANLGMIKSMGFIGGNYGKGTKLVLVHTDDIARVAAEKLLALDFRGKSTLYIVSDEKSTDEIASALGSAIGKTDLQWVDFTDEQSFGGLVQAGLPQEIAKNFIEMGGAMRDGSMFEHFRSGADATAGKVKLQDFAKEFAGAYNN